MQPRAIVKPKNKTVTADMVVLNDANDNFSQDQNASNISESSTTVTWTPGEELNYEPEEEEIAEEVTEEVKEPEVRKKRVRRGRGGEKKKRKEQQEEDGEEAAETVTISCAEWEEMSDFF